VHSYIAYGFSLQSDLALPELDVGSSPPDVVLRLGKVERKPLELDAQGDGFWASAGEACRSVRNVGTCLVRWGREIVVEPAPGVDVRVLRLSILGPALALLLHQRGCFVLHASAVQSGDGAVAFTGGSGWGKSTLAAALHARGSALLADDLTALRIGTGSCTVFPGFPQLKLWPEAAASLGRAPGALSQLHPEFDKRACGARQGFSHRPLPLRRIYLLAEGPGPTIAPLKPHEALIGLMPHWYGCRFGDRLLQVGDAAIRHFRQCAALANSISIHRLTRPRQLGALGDVASLVEEDLAQERDSAVAPRGAGVLSASRG
jgi:hypothetical protein